MIYYGLGEVICNGRLSFSPVIVTVEGLRLTYYMISFKLALNLKRDKSDFEVFNSDDSRFIAYPVNSLVLITTISRISDN